MMNNFRSRVLLSTSCALLIVAVPGCNRDRADDRTGTAGGAVATETGVRVSNVELGRRVGADNRITDRADAFTPRDTIHASVTTSGAGSNATLTARWTYQDDQVVDETTRNLTGQDGEVVHFHISRPSGWPAGNYTLRIMLDGREVETRNFRIS